MGMRGFNHYKNKKLQGVEVINGINKIIKENNSMKLGITSMQIRDKIC